MEQDKSFATVFITERIFDGKPYRAISEIKILVSGVDAAWVPFEVSNTFSWDGQRCQFYYFHNRGGSRRGKLDICGMVIPAAKNEEGFFKGSSTEPKKTSFFVAIPEVITLRNYLALSSQSDFRMTGNDFLYKVQKGAPAIVTPRMAAVTIAENIMNVTLEDLDLPVRLYNNLKYYNRYTNRVNTVGDIMQISGSEFSKRRNVGPKTIKALTEIMKQIGLKWPAVNQKK